MRGGPAGVVRAGDGRGAACRVDFWWSNSAPRTVEFSFILSMLPVVVGANLLCVCSGSFPADC